MASNEPNNSTPSRTHNPGAYKVTFCRKDHLREYIREHNTLK